MSEEVTTSDLYEAAYYLSLGCELSNILSRRVDGKINCQLVFTGFKLPRLQLSYFQGTAEINLFRFRRAYAKINSLVADAKKKARNRILNGGEA